MLKAFISLRSVPISRIIDSYNKYMFNFIRNCQTVFHGGCTSFFLPTVFENYSDCPWWYSHGLSVDVGTGSEAHGGGSAGKGCLLLPVTAQPWGFS